jgi:hypothetical protein
MILLPGAINGSGERYYMSAFRRLLAGFVAVGGLGLALSAGLFAEPESESPTAADSSPRPAASAAPNALPSALITPAAQATANPSPQARPSTGGANLFPFPFATGAPANYNAFVRGADMQRGVIDLIRKDDELYLDLRPENFDKPYIILPTIAKGIGGDAFAGRVYEPLVVIFKRVGKRVLWITPNTHYVADKGTTAAESLSISVADSVLLATPVLAEDGDKRHVVIAPTIFLSDFEGIGTDLGRGVTPPSLPGLLLVVARPSFAVDNAKSYIVNTKAFPRNDEISVNLTFNGPPRVLPTVPDGRGIPIVVHYSIVAPPEHDPSYVPRYADDRIGYFITARKRYGNDELNTPFERFIERWNLANGPIVFTLTNEIPNQYRDTVRRAILTWNTAFARLGYMHAIEVRDPPAEGFDPDDARYNPVRWITSDTPSFAAYSPHVSDPDTGQILRAEVVIDGESMRSIRRGFIDRVLPVQRERSHAYEAAANPSPLAAATGGEDADDDLSVAASCDYQEASAAQGAIGMAELLASPTGSAKQRERYAQDWLFATVLHEVGHTLGLRHNFQGSTQFTYAQLHDPDFTAAHGITASVMDYVPANVAAPNEHQGTFFAVQLGSYDLWAIQYGYVKTGAKTSSEELPALRRIADRSAEPGHAYGTDEDTVSPFALDPRIARFDLSSDPLAFDREQFAIDDDVTSHLVKSYKGDARSYQDIRQTFVTMLNNQLSATILASRYIGGVYTSRDHRGERGGAPPFRSIPRDEQRRAFDLVDRYVFSSQAFVYPPGLLNMVAPDRFGLHWNSGGIRRADFPVREVVGEIQDAAIAQMFAPAALARIGDQAIKGRPGETMSLADLFAWTNAAIYDDLGQPTIAPLHRDLQRRFADLQMQIAFLPSPAMDQLGLPREVQALARYSLRGLKPKLDTAYARATDVATKAHIDDLRSRIAGALSPNANRSI